MRTLLLFAAVLVLCAPPVDARGSSGGGRRHVKKGKSTRTRAAGTRRARSGRRGTRPRRGAQRRRGTRQRGRTESAEGIITPNRGRTPRTSPERRTTIRKRENKLRVRVTEKWTTADGVQRTKVFETRPRPGRKKTTTRDLLRSGAVSNNGIINAENTLARVRAAEAKAKLGAGG